MALPPASLPWYKSRVLVGAAISAIFKLIFAVLVLFDARPDIGDDELAPIIDALVLLVSFAGDAIAARARVVQKHAPPVTLKRKDT